MAVSLTFTPGRSAELFILRFMNTIFSLPGVLNELHAAPKTVIDFDKLCPPNKKFLAINKQLFERNNEKERWK
jgi:hypothetical protein